MFDNGNTNTIFILSISLTSLAKDFQKFKATLFVLFVNPQNLQIEKYNVQRTPLSHNLY